MSARNIIIKAPEVPHPGGHPSSHFMRTAARNLRQGYPVGGSNVTDTIARLLDRVADAMDAPRTPAATGDTITDRGFRHTEPVEGQHGGRIRVYESSDASGPHVWIAIDDRDANSAVHLTVEQARAHAANVLRVCDLHYQAEDARR